MNVQFTDIAHLATLLVVVIGTIVLRVEHDISETMLSGVLLAALGYATGISVGRKTNGP